MLNNLFGDFVKGSNLSAYSSSIQRGITLHRSIDSFIDTHPKVIELMHSLYPHLPKVSGIAIDLFFDHILAKKWENYHPLPLPEFLRAFYQSITLTDSTYPPAFTLFIEKLVEVNWISYYPQFEGLQKACQGVSKRLSFPNTLSEAPNVFTQFEAHIETVFYQYMDDAKVKFSTIV
jgi:acyl carrier protein phosphodiesterase